MPIPEAAHARCTGTDVYTHHNLRCYNTLQNLVSSNGLKLRVSAQADSCPSPVLAAASCSLPPVTGRDCLGAEIEMCFASRKLVQDILHRHVCNIGSNIIRRTHHAYTRRRA